MFYLCAGGELKCDLIWPRMIYTRATNSCRYRVCKSSGIFCVYVWLDLGSKKRCVRNGILMLNTYVICICGRKSLIIIIHMHVLLLRHKVTMVLLPLTSCYYCALRSVHTGKKPVVRVCLYFFLSRFTGEAKVNTVEIMTRNTNPAHSSVLWLWCGVGFNGLFCSLLRFLAAMENTHKRSPARTPNARSHDRQHVNLCSVIC